MENNEKKLNPVAKFFRDWWIGTVDSFRYNPCKLAGILVLLPGVFIGFFLGFHSGVTFFVNADAGEQDFSGLLMFVLVLMGCVNIFNGVTLMGKRNLGSVIVSSLCSAIIVICGVFWIERIFYSKHLIDEGIVKLTSGEGFTFTFNHIMSIGSVVLAMLCSVLGCILGYINRNKDYKKVTF